MSFWQKITPRCDKCGEPYTKVALYHKGNKIFCWKCWNEDDPPPKETVKKVEGWNELITPKNFNGFIGQEVIKRELDTMLAATKIHTIPVQHVLFSGSFGLGKTTIANIFANAIGNNTFVLAPNVRINDFPKTPVVVVDEIHSIADEEGLLGIMDRSGQTILGATTSAGSLSGPLRSRFISLVLQPYTEEELSIIVKNAAKNLKYDCPDYVAIEVARRGKAVARTTLFLFKRIYDRAILKGEISPKILGKWFKEMKIDHDGLDNADRAYLSCLSDKPVGLQNLSAMTGMDRITIEETVEPYLLTKGFVKRTARGRILGDRTPLNIW